MLPQLCRDAGESHQDPGCQRHSELRTPPPPPHAHKRLRWSTSIEGNESAKNILVAEGRATREHAWRVYLLCVCLALLRPLLRSRLLGAGVFVAPVGRHAVLSDEVHLVGADLHLHGGAVRQLHHRVQRLVAVALGVAHIVLEPTRHLGPQPVHLEVGTRNLLCHHSEEVWWWHMRGSIPASVNVEIVEHILSLAGAATPPSRFMWLSVPMTLLTDIGKGRGGGGKKKSCDYSSKLHALKLRCEGNCCSPPHLNKTETRGDRAALSYLIQDGIAVGLALDHHPEGAHVVHLVQPLLLLPHFPHHAVQVLGAPAQVHALSAGFRV